MCGIVGYIGTKKAVPVLINGLLSLEYRGYDSAGIAVLNSSKSSDYELDIFRDKGRVKNLQDNKDLQKSDSTIGIAHTRWATHGIPSKENAHPHTNNDKNIAVVHNGIIENYDKLRTFLSNKGYTLYSETDTEVIPNLVDYYYKKNKDFSEAGLLKAVADTLNDLIGSYAIGVLSNNFPDQIIVAKKDSPLVVGKGDGENYIASDIPAVLSHTKNFYFMEDGELAVISKDNIDFYNTFLKKIKKDLKNIEWDSTQSEKNGYDDFMLKEIFEQPKAVLETIGTSFEKDKINLPLDDIKFSKFNKIYIVACGTAMHAGLATKYTFEKFAKIPMEVDVSSEFRYRDPLINEHTLCIFISQSGETADTIAALKLAKSKGSTTIAIVNVIGSSITRLADYVLYTHAGPEIAVASTKAYTCQTTLLNILALYIAENNLNNLDDKEVKELASLKKDILSLPQKIEDALKTADAVKDIAKNIYKKKDVFFIGRNTDYTVSLEASLKLKEISYIHSDAYAAGELKHGSIALMEDSVDVIGIVTNTKILPKTISNLEEVITRGANVYIITDQTIDNKAFKNIISIPKISYMLSPIVSVIPLQLLAYYVAKNKKLDVDKPRNLAKSVTVE